MTDSNLSKDDDLIFIEEDLKEPERTGKTKRVWKILIVDDDSDVHHATRLALKDLKIENRSLLLLHAYSSREALDIIQSNRDLAVLLLDVVMEEEDSGLKLVEHIRDKMQRKELRIILRTGQPGYAPEIQTISNYDINDYKTKSELTQIKLFTCLTTAIRSYIQINSQENMRCGLELVIQASTNLNKLVGILDFAKGVVHQICAMLQMPPEGLICVKEGLKDGSEPPKIVAAAGSYSHLMHKPLSELDDDKIKENLNLCLNERKNIYEPVLILYFGTEIERGMAAFVNIQRSIKKNEQHLLQVFCASISVGFENVILYERLTDQVYQDPMLGISNLNHLLQTLSKPRLKKEKTTLALLDIDDFSAINDTLGHEVGDAVLYAVSQRLKDKMPKSLVARLGSDIFALLGPSEELRPEFLHGLFRRNFRVFGECIKISTTIGLVELKEDEKCGSSFLKDAHVALKEAKTHQKGASIYFSKAMGEDARERMHLLIQLREAYDKKEVFLMYQPKVELETGRIKGLEALVRWRGKNNFFISPERFIPLAEKSSLIIPLGTLILNSACQQLARLNALGYKDINMAINISQVQFRDPDFISKLENAIKKAGVLPSNIELEITESMAISDFQHVQKLLKRIDALGVKIAIDDFGTGFSSLSVLKHLKTQRLKIDKSFINEISEDRNIVDMLIKLGHSLGMSITAEGIEDEEQFHILKELECDEGQGWFFAYPMEEEDLLKWLKKEEL